MKVAVCTLFEGDHHYGLAALANSLCAHGFRGVIWAGYRGKLPPWASPTSEKDSNLEYMVKDGCVIRFVLLVTKAHFANCKPQFMLDLLVRTAPETGGVFYFDPDITICCRWSFFEEWSSFGVALCEDVNSPVSETHPLRAGWRIAGARQGVDLRARTPSYVNSGFVGVARSNVSFLRAWREILEFVNAEMGGAEKFNLCEKDRTYLYYRGDQDALNMAIEASNAPVSIVGKEGMGFSNGGCIMYHALGGAKPWNRKFMREALNGLPPSGADKAFMNYAEHPISPYSGVDLRRRRLSLLVASAISRIIRKAGL